MKFGSIGVAGPDCGQCTVNVFQYCPTSGELGGGHGVGEKRGGGIKGSLVRGVISRSGWSATPADVRDGMSSTFLAGECVGARCLWQDWGFQNQAATSRPLNWEHPLIDQYDRVETPAHCRSFRSCHRGGASFVMMDGSVSFIVNEIEFTLYQGLSTRNAGPLQGEVP